MILRLSDQHLKTNAINVERVYAIDQSEYKKYQKVGEGAAWYLELGEQYEHYCQEQS